MFFKLKNILKIKKDKSLQLFTIQFYQVLKNDPITLTT